MLSLRKYFGYNDEQGEYKILATYQFVWAGGIFASQIVMDVPAGFMADCYGRKFLFLKSLTPSSQKPSFRSTPEMPRVVDHHLSPLLLL